MNKAKLLLTIVAMFSVVGASLAYKANRILHRFYLETTTTTILGQPITVCSVSTLLLYSVDDAGFITIKASTASINTPCPIITVDWAS